MIAGICMRNYVVLPIPVLAGGVLFAAIAWLFSEWMSGRNVQPEWTFRAFASYHILIVICSFIRMDVADIRRENEAQRWAYLDVFEQTDVEISGTVRQVRRRSTGSQIWLDADTLFSGSQNMIRDGTVGFVLRWESSVNLPELGDRVAGIVQYRLPAGVRNPYDFDYREWLLQQDIRYQGRISEVVKYIQSPSLMSWTALRRGFERLVTDSFSQEQLPVVKALLLGQKGDIETDERDAFAKAGLSHLMAVSGLHVGFVLAPLWLLIPFFWSMKFGRVIGFFFIGGFLFLYAGLTGFSASVMRASIMAVLAAFSRLFRQPRESLNLMAVAAIIILWIDPYALWDLGFQLSFTAVSILLILMPVVQKVLPDWTNRKPWSVFTSLVIVSIVVQVGLYPILAHGFGEYSLMSPISNITGIPATQVLVLWSMFALPVAALFPDHAQTLMWPAEYAAHILRRTAEYSSAMPSASVYVSDPPFSLFLVFFTAMVVLVCSGHALRWKAVGVFLCSLVLFMGQMHYKRWTKPVADILFYDVGQGDGALIHTHDGASWLMDAGVFGMGSDSGKFTILPVLRRMGIRKLDGIVLSHPHADHIGGVLSILENIPVDTLYEADFPTSSALVAGYQRAAKRLGVPIVKLRHGRVLQMGEHVRGYVLAPVNPELHSDPNTASVVVKVVAGEVSVLFTGDADMEAEHEILSVYGDLLSSNVLKAGHHGSKTSSSEAFMQTVNPEYTVVSLAWRNRYNHPHAEAIRRIQPFTGEMFFTSREGAVWMQTDGQRIWRKPWK